MGRRNLTEDRRRSALAIAGVAVSLLLVLLLDGILSGALRQVTAYPRGLAADVIVSQQGVRTLHMSVSVLPRDSVAQAATVDGVRWVAPISFASGVVASPEDRMLAYVIGYDTAAGRGGPTALAEGRAPRPGELVLDEAGARQLDVGVGDQVIVLGRTARISGLSTGGTSITNTIAFVPASDLYAQAPSYLLARAEPGVSADDLADGIRQALPYATVQTRDEFVASEERVVLDMSAEIMQVMAVLGLLVALAVIGLSLYALTTAKLREYGVLAALGARPTHLARAVAAQALWTVIAGVLLAIALAAAAAALIGRSVSQLTIDLTATSALRVAVGALLVGTLAALLPVRRVVSVDPATAFRRPQ